MDAMPNGQTKAAKLAGRAGATPGERTGERSLDGSLRAIARHGLGKLGMNDAGASGWTGWRS
jgi:hypothetical protein